MAYSKLKHSVTHHAARVCQCAAFPIVWFVSNAFIPTTVHGHERLGEATGPTLDLANHVAFYDSFLLRLATRWKTLPIRFMGVTSFRRPHLRILKSLGLVHAAYLLFGVFTIVPGRGLEKNTEIAKAILLNGGRVLIYPEGSINTTGGLLPFKQGAAVLALATGANVVPIAFHTKKSPLGAIGRDHTHIYIGQAFKPNSTVTENATRELRAALEKSLEEIKEKLS